MTRSQAGTLAAASLAATLVWLSASVVTTALPSIASGLGASLDTLQAVITVYTLVLAALLVVGGRLGDARGRRRMLLIGIVVFAAGSALSAASRSSELLLVGRAVMGVGGALVLPATLSVIAAAFPPRSRGAALGAWGAAAGLGQAGGAPLGGVLVSAIGWPSVFWINVPLAALVLVLVALCVRESRDPEQTRVGGAAGVILWTLALAALAFGLSESNDLGWGSPEILAALVGGAALIVAFIVVDRRARVPLVDRALTASRPFRTIALLNLVANAAVTAATVFGALYMQGVLQLSAAEAGALLLASTIPSVGVPPIGGWFIDRHGPRAPLVVGILLLAASLIVLSTVGRDTAHLTLVIAFALLGTGSGLLFVVAPTVALNSVATAKAGAASGGLKTTSMLGAALGVAVGGAVVQQIETDTLASALRSLGTAADAARLAGLEGALADPSGAKSTLDALGDLAEPALAAVREAFTDGFTASMIGWTVLALLASIPAFFALAHVRATRAPAGAERAPAYDRDDAG